ncbi:MAG: ABC transporter permease [Rhodoblastus sp.]|nr:ABC transporter permease [Rhodoblastus sp.]MCB1523207.1 ABC transporter permease [Rhodoblastus sp.]
MADGNARNRLAPVPFRGAGFAPGEHRLGGAAALVALVAIWQAISSFLGVSPLFLPSPIAIARALWRLIVEGDLLSQIGVSALRIAAGWSLGASIGLVVGLAMGLFTFARAAGFAIVSALFPIPKIALLPLMILWFGIGEPSKIATIALGVFFPTAISAASGVDSVPRNLIRMAQSFGLPFADIVRKVVLPGALPSILAGFRISTSIALLLVVSAEMVGAERGIGAFVLQAGNLMQTDQLLAGVVVLSGLGLAVARAIAMLEKRFSSWR